MHQHTSRAFRAWKSPHLYQNGQPLQRQQTPLTREEFQSLTGLGTDICAKIACHLDLVGRWRLSGRLMSAGALNDPWRRHILDSWNLFNLLPRLGLTLVDIGSGAGFPALPIALMGRFDIHLIESNQRKAAFLAAVRRCLELDTVSIYPQRALTVRTLKADVVCARAVAPIERLIALASPFLRAGTLCLFPQGKNQIRSPLTDRIDRSKFTSDLIANPFDRHSGGILRLVAH